jgi:hypothetical protein
MRGVYFDIRGERAELYTLMLMCGRMPSLSNLTTFLVRDFERTFANVVENAMGRVRTDDRLPSSGALAQVVKDAAADLGCPYLGPTLERAAIELARDYCVAQGLNPSSAPACPENAFWVAINHAVQWERGAFVRPWFPDVPGTIAANPPATMPEEFWTELAERIERKKAQFGPVPASMSREEHLDAVEEQEVADGIYGYPMLSGLLLLVIAILDLNYTKSGRTAQTRRSKTERPAHWASVNMASRIIERWTVRAQLSARGYTRDVNETTLKESFSDWSWIAPLWAAAFVEANRWDEKMAPNLREVWLRLKYDILGNVDRRVNMFGTARWFSIFAANYRTDRAHRDWRLIPEEVALRIPDAIVPVEPTLPILPKEVLRGVTKE